MHKIVKHELKLHCETAIIRLFSVVHLNINKIAVVVCFFLNLCVILLALIYSYYV